LMAGASEQAALSGNTAAYLQTIINSANWIIQDTRVYSGDYRGSLADFNTSTDTMTRSGAQAWVHYLNIVGLALSTG